MTHPFNIIDEADFVGRFENFNADFATICHHRGLTAAPALPLLHRSRETPSIKDLIRKKLGKLIAYYERDYLRFGYPIPRNQSGGTLS
jgi:hypothetical protein